MVQKTIFVVDHEPNSLSAICDTIKGFGYSCSYTESAIEALALLGLAIPDLIILDLGTHETSGLRFIRRIRSAPVWSGIPIIAMSDCREREEREIIKAGANAFLKKPFTIEKLQATIDQLLSSPS